MTRRDFSLIDASGEQVEAEPDAQTQRHLQRLDRAKLDSFKQDTKLRSKFADRIHTIAVLWSAYIAIIVVEVGHGRMYLSDTVLAALITTTTATVFGSFYVVAKYLFTHRG